MALCRPTAATPRPQHRPQRHPDRLAVQPGWGLDHLGERQRLEDLTGLPVRSTPRLTDEPKPHPMSDVFVGAPMTANSVAKPALGIADNQAVTVLCECVGTVPMIIFPRVNAAHARQPAWNDHLNRLRSVGVELIYGQHVWPLAEPRTAGPGNCPGPRSSAP